MIRRTQRVGYDNDVRVGVFCEIADEGPVVL